MKEEVLKQLEADMIAARAEMRFAAARKAAYDRAAASAAADYVNARTKLENAKRRMEIKK